MRAEAKANSDKSTRGKAVIKIIRQVLETTILVKIADLLETLP